MNDKPVTAESLTIGQVRELFETSADADVVRAAIRVLADGPAGIRFLLRGDVGDHDTKKALATLAAAWNACAPTPGVTP